jgi:thioredoxin-like negative regulator of GroEL
VLAALRLADLLIERGDLDGAEQVLRAGADAGDLVAAGQLADLLAERGDLDGLRARADAGDWSAAGPLAGLLMRQGRGEESERLRRFGLNPDGSIACA